MCLFCTHMLARPSFVLDGRHKQQDVRLSPGFKPLPHGHPVAVVDRAAFQGPALLGTHV